MGKLKLENKVLIFAVLIAFSGLLLFFVRESRAEDFSEELEHEPYTSVSSLENWYDAYETFYYDTAGNAPQRWVWENFQDDLTYGGYYTFEVDADQANHKNVLKFRALEDVPEVTWLRGRHYFQEKLNLTQNEEYLYVSFYYREEGDPGSYHLYLKNGGTKLVEFDLSSSMTIRTETSDTESGISKSLNTWYFFEIYCYKTDTTHNWEYYRDGSELHSVNITNSNDVVIDRFEMYTSGTAVSQDRYIFLDALNYQTYDSNDESQLEIYNEIENVICDIDDNQEAFGSTDYFSMYSTLLSNSPTEDNNYRTELISDEIITQNYVNPERILRMSGSDTVDTKYKVNQFYFTGIDEAYDEYETKEVQQDYSSTATPSAFTLNNTGDLGSIDDNYYVFNSTISFPIDSTKILINSITGSRPRADINNVIDGDIGTGSYVTSSNSVGWQWAQLNFDLTNLSRFRIYDPSLSYDLNDMSFQLSSNGGTSFFDPTNFRDGYIHNETDESQYWLDYNSQPYTHTIYSDGDIDNYYTCDGWITFMFDRVQANTLRITFDGKKTPNTHLYSREWEVYDEGNYDGITNDALDMSFYVNCSDLEAYHSIDNIYLNYSMKTDSVQTVNLSVYNQDLGQWEVINSSSATEFFANQFTLNSSYLNSSNCVLFNITAVNSTQDFQLYIDQFQVTYEYYEMVDYEPTQQKLQIRVDTLDSDDTLINILHWNIEFNNTAGLITWNISYRESEAVPRWGPEPTNPIFDFDDYLGEDEVVESLQINAHFFLTEYDNQKWLHIRTEVCFNDYYDNIYSYDKVIDLGNNTFYDTQNRLAVRYIDYINPNYFNPYTYSNLEGFRTLKLTSTDMKYNFLDAGFYNLDLDIKPPADDEEPDDDEPPDDDQITPPVEQEYDYYLPVWWFTIKEKQIVTHEVGDNESLDVPDGVVYNWEIDFPEYEIEYEVKKFGFIFAAIPYERASDWGNWYWTLDIGLGQFKVPLNWARNLAIIGVNILIGIVNTFYVVFVQGAVWLGANLLTLLIILTFGSLGVYIIWNVMFQAIWVFGAVPIWWVAAGFALAIWFFLWLWNEVIIPLAEWFLETFLPWWIDLWITIMVSIFAIFITLIAGEPIGGEYYLSLVENGKEMMYQIGDFLLMSIVVFVYYFPTFLKSIVLYLLFCGMIYFRFWYSKMSGNLPRAKNLKASFESYIQPFIIAKKIIQTIKDTSPQVAGTG